MNTRANRSHGSAAASSRGRASSRAVRLSILLAAILALALVAGCEGGFFKPLMEGEGGSAWEGDLAISPATATLTYGASLDIKVTGGDGSYAFSVVGDGSFDAGAMLYTAPTIAGTERLLVADGAGATAEAVLTIKSAMSPDYRVALSPVVVFPATGTGGTAAEGSFVIENISSEPGLEPIGWTVYVSRDAAWDSLDLVAASGSHAALEASSVSESIAFAGTWPTVGYDYYLIIALSAADDDESANDGAVSSAIAVTGAARPDYSIASIGAPAIAGRSKAFTQTLVVGNTATGAGDGTRPLDWAVYLSADASLDGADAKLGGGTLATGIPAGGTTSLSYSGAYPDTPGAYFIIATLSAFDDASTSNDTAASSPILVSGPDYNVTAIAAPSAGSAGQALGGLLTFTIRNDGPGDGDFPVAWSIYASLGDSTLDAGDSLIASGSAAAMAAGGTVSPGFAGSWPMAAGSYCLVATVQAADDATIGELATAPVLVSSPDYVVTTVAGPATVQTAGQAFSGSFAIQNDGLGLGVADVSWSVYLSPGDSSLDAGDSLIASGSAAAMAAGGTVSPGFSGSWPMAAGSYWLIATVLAADETATTNNGAASTEIVVSGPDYVVTTVAVPAFKTAGQAFGGSFTIRNDGPVAGTSSIAWSVYASLGNSTLDAGDSLIASGTDLALAAGASVSPSYTGTWPRAEGGYFLVARAEADDDATVAELASSAITVSYPDYEVTIIGAPTNQTAGLSYDWSFTIANVGLGLGVADVAWSVYFSAVDSVLGAGDSLVASGSVPALAPGDSISPSFSGTWPAAPGDYYLLFFAEADDDVNAANDQAGASLAVSP